MADNKKAASGFNDGLKKILGDLAQLSVSPDADPQFIMMLQQGITQYIRQRMQATTQPNQGSPAGGMGGGAPTAGPPGGAGPDMSPPSPQSIAPGGGAGMSGFGTPNPDELRRVLAGPAAPGTAQ